MNLRSIVDAKRKQTEQERKFFISSHVLKILRAISKGKISLYSVKKKVDELEDELDRFVIQIGNYWPEIWIKVIHKELGDPRQMAEEGLRQHARPYWNPTKHKINIFPLGIIKSISQDKTQVEYYNLIEPGEQVMIPWGNTVGGKNSALTCVAPQLQPLPGIDLAEEHLEVRPLTFVEWCAFGDAYLVSDCCRKQILWSEKKQALVCQKCHEKT